MSKVKQVIIIRKDLKMRLGKSIVSGSHASMKIFLDKIFHSNKQPEWSSEELEWINGIFIKICVGVNSEKELIDCYDKAKEAGLNCSLIKDSGLTEFSGVPTYTCVAIGPNYSEKIDLITGHLKLL